MEGLLNDLLSGMILQVVGKLQSTNRHMDSTWGFWDQWFIAMDWNAREKKTTQTSCCKHPLLVINSEQRKNTPIWTDLLKNTFNTTTIQIAL